MRRASGRVSSEAVITSSCPGVSPSPTLMATSASRSRRCAWLVGAVRLTSFMAGSLQAGHGRLGGLAPKAARRVGAMVARAPQRSTRFPAARPARFRLRDRTPDPAGLWRFCGTRYGLRLTNFEGDRAHCPQSVSIQDPGTSEMRVALACVAVLIAVLGAFGVSRLLFSSPASVAAVAPVRTDPIITGAVARPTVAQSTAQPAAAAPPSAMAPTVQPALPPAAPKPVIAAPATRPAALSPPAACAG